MTTHIIRKGFDIKLAGRPEARVDDCPDPPSVGMQPRELQGLKLKVLVREGDRVRTGQPILADKARPEVVFCATATGAVTKVELGRRRFPERIEIEPAGRDEFWDGPALDPARLGGTAREAVVEALHGAGLWPLVRQRPLGKIAAPEKAPVAIFVNAMDTEPLAADPAVALAGAGDALQLGIDVLRRLTDGPVYLTRRAGAALPPALQTLRGVEVHDFAGPHPAGLVGTHIARVRPLKGDEVVWYLKAAEAAAIGEWAATGHHPTHRVVAVAGSAAPRRQYFRVRQGAALATLLGGRPAAGTRVINGTVLSGRAVDADGFLGVYAHTVTAIPDGGDRRDLLGWALPQFGRLSASRAVLSWLRPQAEYEPDARVNGGVRAMVNIGQWDRMTPLDIHPSYLVRAIQAGDLEEAIGLGLLEVTEEDVALCTFADPCKIEVGDIIRKGLDLYEKEG